MCKDALNLEDADLSNRINEEIAGVLLELLNNGELGFLNDETVDGSQEDTDNEAFDSHKRDEIVQVHKYFDKSKSQRKRDPYFERLQADLPYQYVYNVDDNEDVSNENIDESIKELAESNLLANSQDREQQYPVFDVPNSNEDEDMGPPPESAQSNLEGLEQSKAESVPYESEGNEEGRMSLGFVLIFLSN